MSKKKSRFKFILTGLAIVIGAILCCCSFDIPGTYYTFKGWANSIKLGIDLSGGISAVYECSVDANSTTTLDDAINATISRITSMLTDKGFTEATVVKQGTDRIRVEVPDVSDPQEIFNLIGSPAKLEIKSVEDASAEAELTGNHITNVEASYQNGEYGVSIEFNAEGSTVFYNMTSEAANTGSSIYIYIGGELFSSPTCNEAIAGGKTFISGSMETLEDAENFATKIMSGTFSANLRVLENNVISATLGDNALLTGVIAGAISIALIFIFMFVIYKNMGLIANMSLAIYAIILIFLLHCIPGVQLTLPSIAGIILSLGMAVDANVIIFERIKDEYKSGKKIPASVKAGFKKSTMAIVDGNVTTIIASIVLYLLGTGSIKGFAITLLLGIVVSLFTSLVVTRSLMNASLALNSTNAKKYGLKREETVNDIQ